MIKGLRYYNAYLKDKRLFKQAGITDRDFFLASFPKSGNTWLRFILARALFPEAQINTENLQHYFPTVHRSTASEIRKLSSPRFIKTHAAFYRLYPRCIYIVRDVRAVTVSGWFHAKAKAKYTGTLEEFIDGPLNTTFGPWHWHVSEALAHRRVHKDKMLFLRYEDLLAKPLEVTESILQFTGITPIIPVSEIVRITAFKNLQEVEKSVQHNPEQLFFRSGTENDWKNYLTTALESKLLNDETRGVMQDCDYL